MSLVELAKDFEVQLAAELEMRLHIPMDVVPLKQTPTRFRHYVLTKGEVIPEEEPGLHEALLARALDELPNAETGTAAGGGASGKRP